MIINTDLVKGITFRHQQNPSINATVTKGKFYGYRDTFVKGEYFLPVPNTCKCWLDEFETRN